MSKEFGDFPTPPALVTAILECLTATGKVWHRVLEPACGSGNFIAGLLKLPHPPLEIQGIEIQTNHIHNVNKIANSSKLTRIVINQRKFFDLNLSQDLQWQEKGNLLVIGNPPWITNSQLGRINSNNLPPKLNFKKLRGLDALTGSSNFDITEYFWLKIIQEIAYLKPNISLLCKTSVARNVLQFAWDNNLPITNASLRIIDAKKYFNAAVSACLFSVDINPEKPRYEADVYPNLQAKQPDYTIGIAAGKIIANIAEYNHSGFIEGICPLTWRQGIKHDAVAVMEITYNQINKTFTNKLGENVIVENEYIYALLKSSDLFHKVNIIKTNNHKNNQLNRYVIVTQKYIGENTKNLQQNAPLLWKYLNSHIDKFEGRKSSIYKGKPPFSMFGIGDYAFVPYKVGISGLYKIPKFQAIGKINDRPVMLDDTCYFIPCNSPEQAALLTTLLNHSLCLNFIYARFFPDAKRPITKKLLQCIDIKKILSFVDKQSLLAQAEIEFDRLVEGKQKPVWPSLLAQLLLE